MKMMIHTMEGMMAQQELVMKTPMDHSSEH